MEPATTRPDSELQSAWLDAIPMGAVWRALAPDPEAFDPGSVRDRLRLYRRLIRDSGAPPRLGAGGERHIFWGYAAQLHWQCESGRLGERVGGDRIDGRSWWGAMNATLSLLPVRAAQGAGLLEDVVVQRPGDPLAEHEAAFALARQRWSGFFRAVAGVESEADWEAARVVGWRAHVTSIEAGARVFAPLFAQMSGPERRFGRGWTRMVDFFGRAALRTDLEAIARFRSSLPPRPLTESDAGGAIPDFDEATRDATDRITALAEMPTWRFALHRRVWNRAMRDPALREASLDILFGDLGRDPEIRRRFRRALLPGPLRD